MAAIKSKYKRFNGVAWEEYYFETSADQVIGLADFIKDNETKLSTNDSTATYGKYISRIQVSDHGLTITKADLPTGFSGNYDDLSNKPTIDQLLGNLSTLGFVKRTGTNNYVIDTSTYQPLDADLTAIAAIPGTSGLLRKTAFNTWQLDTSVYLTAITKAQVEAVLTGTITTHTHNASEIVEDASHRFVTDTQIFTWDDKVDKVDGKGLSTNDYTTAEKNKLSDIESGAEVNVQSDWTQEVNTADDYIKNKPVIPNKVSDLTNDTGYITGYTETDPIFTAWDKSTGISITKSQVSDLIEATQALSGLMSATDKQRLDVLHALLEEDTENNVVDSINEILAIFENYPEGADLVTALAGKVDKVSGKGLSTEDYTSAEKTKLSDIQAGAEVNVQSDWNATSGDALILNKPVIPTKVSDLTNDTGYITGYTETDPIFTAWDKSTGISITKSQVSDFAHDHNNLYYTEAEIDVMLQGLPVGGHTHTESDITDLDKYTQAQVDTLLNDKVDKVEGKGLSTNDYTTTEKNKLAGIASGAEVNVQSDWNATSGDALILNKPTIPTKVSDLTNDSDFTTKTYVDSEIHGKIGDIDFSEFIKSVNEKIPNQTGGITLTHEDVDAVPLSRTISGLILNGDISEADLRDTLQEATNLSKGLMSNTDKEKLESLWGIFDAGDSVFVDTLVEIMEVFENYPEETNLFDLIGEKVTKNPPITGNTKTKITYDSKGLVTGGSTLDADDIPFLDASKINSGRFTESRLPDNTVYSADLSPYTKISDIVNNLTSTDTNKPLSANQGKVLNDTTAKLEVSNVFTQPQIVPNAENDDEAVNLGQLNMVVSIWRYE